MISLNFRDSRPIYKQIKDGFVRLIVSGALGADEKLPSVRELAQSLAINPNTIQKAYTQMENEGYIYTVSGKGSFACQDKAVMDRMRGELMKDLVDTSLQLLDLGVSKNEIIDKVNGLNVKE